MIADSGWLALALLTGAAILSAVGASAGDGDNAAAIEEQQVPVADFNSPDIVHLTPDTFDQSIAAGRWMVEFYSPMCVHCQVTAPVYAKVAQKHIGLRESRNFTIASLDCQQYEAKCTKLDISGFPTFNFYIDGTKVKEFLGARTETALSDFVEVESMATAPMNGQVVELGAAGFEQRISAGPWFIKFYAPWCGHCIKLAPIWETLAQDTVGQVNIAKVNCEAESTMTSKMSIRGFPTLKFFFDGEEVSEYKGPRQLQDMKAFAEAMSKPPTSVVEGAEKLTELITQHGVVFLLVGPRVAARLPKVFVTSARKFSMFAKFGVSSDDVLISQYGTDQHSRSVLVFKDGIHERYDGEFTADALQPWIALKKYPTVFELDYVNSADVFKLHRFVVIIFAENNFPEVIEGHKITLKKVASTSNTGDDALFTWINGALWSRYAESVFGVRENQMPTTVIVHPDGDEYFPTGSDGLPIAATVASIESALNDARQHKLSPKHIQGFMGRVLKYARNAGHTLWDFARNNMVVVLLLVCAMCAAVYWLLQRGQQGDGHGGLGGKLD